MRDARRHHEREIRASLEEFEKAQQFVGRRGQIGVVVREDRGIRVDDMEETLPDRLRLSDILRQPQHLCARHRGEPVEGRCRTVGRSVVDEEQPRATGLCERGESGRIEALLLVVAGNNDDR